MKSRTKVLFLGACVIALAAAAFSGCGQEAGDGAGTVGKLERNTSVPEHSSVDDKKFEGKEAIQTAEKSAAEKALEYAREANTGSSFKVTDKVVTVDWARVAVEQTGVPREEAVTFDIYMRRLEDGRWEVVETGTGLSAEDLPEAPAELFD